MKKMYLIAMFAAVLMLNGCKKSETTSNDSVNLKGMWSSEPNSAWWLSDYSSNPLIRDDVYEFMNDNTVVYYGSVGNITHPDLLWSKQVPGHSGWYYEGSINRTYVFASNKIVLSNGDVFSYIDGKLYKHNSSVVLSRW